MKPQPFLPPARRWALLLLLCLAGCAAPKRPEGVGPSPARDRVYPAPASGFVTDLAGVIPESDCAYLNRMLADTERKTGVEIAVVTIRSIRDYPGVGDTIEAFAMGLFNAWGVGKLPANDGVLLLVAIKDRQARIELGAGYGRRRDADAQRIMDTVLVPRFREGAYSTGIVEGCEALAGEFTGAPSGGGA